MTWVDLDFSLSKDWVRKGGKSIFAPYYSSSEIKSLKQLTPPYLFHFVEYIGAIAVLIAHQYKKTTRLD